MGKIWKRPLVFFEEPVSGGGSGSVIGDGSGQSSPDIIPYGYVMWSILFEDQPDNNLDGDEESCEYDDYVLWMKKYGFDDYIEEEP